MSQVKKQTGFIPSIFTDLLEDNFFNDSLNTRSLSKWIPPANIKESDSGYKLELAVPGFEKSQFKITLENDLLSISAEMKEEKNVEEKNYSRKEFKHSSFRRTFRVAKDLNEKDVKATYENGILKINLPKNHNNKGTVTKEIKIG